MADLGKITTAIEQIKANPGINCSNTGERTTGCSDKERQLEIQIFQSPDSTIISQINNVNNSVFEMKDLNGDGKIDQTCIRRDGNYTCRDVNKEP